MLIKILLAGALLGAGYFLLLPRSGAIRNLPKGVLLGLVLAVMVPALGHLYIFTKASIPYVAGMLALGWLLHAAMGGVPAYLILAAVSTGLMYYRLMVRGER